MDTSKFNSFDQGHFLKFSNPALIEKDLQTLVGILNGVTSDAVINSTEYQAVQSWVNSKKGYEEKQPYKTVLEIIRVSFNDGILTIDETQNIVWFCNQYISKTSYYDAITAGIQKLTGILKGVIIDGNVNFTELEYLDSWLEEHDFLKNSYPYDEIYNLTTSIIQDKTITPEEQEALLTFCHAFIDDSGHNSNTTLVSSLKTGFYQIDPTINIQEKCFCITGLSKKYKRREIAEQIELYGGYVVDRVSSKLDYLIVCDEKNTCWAFTCYGRKIEEAIKHRKQGAKLAIVHEYDLYDTLQGM